MKKPIFLFAFLAASFNINYAAVDFKTLMQNTNKSPATVFQEEVINGALPTIVDFFAPWCPACRVVGPLFDKISNDLAYQNKIRFIKVNYDDYKDLCKLQQVKSLPYFGFYKDGLKRHFIIGKKNESELRSAIQTYLI